MAKRILVIDDDAFIRDLYEEVLKSDGYEVTTAIDGEQGLLRLKEGGFDAILLDVMMPKLDGIGVLTKIKESPPTTPNGPIIVMTNLDHDPILTQATSLGVRECLLKADMLPPVLLEHVKRAIQTSPNAGSQPAR